MHLCFCAGFVSDTQKMRRLRCRNYQFLNRTLRARQRKIRYPDYTAQPDVTALSADLILIAPLFILSSCGLMSAHWKRLELFFTAFLQTVKFTRVTYMYI